MRRPIGVLVCSLLLAAPAVVVPAPAHAQNKAELASARKLFGEALQDEQAQRYDVALEKFHRVQAVKDTVQVRYRIATCLEGLAKLKDARDAYDATIQLGEGDKDKATQDVVAAAKQRFAELSRRLPELTISPSAHAPDDAEIFLDQQKLPPSSLRTPIPLDPGHHEVSATATGAVPFRTELTLDEGSHLSLVIPLEPSQSAGAAVGAGTGQPAGSGAGQSSGGASGAGAGQAGGAGQPGGAGVGADAGTPGRGRRTWGWIAVGGGAALLAGSGVVVLMRHGEISTIKDACPGGVCPRSREAEVSSARSRALTEGPVAAVLAGAGVVAVGVGAYLLLTHPKSATDARPQVSAGIGPGGASVGLTGSF